MVTPNQGLSASDLANRARVATLRKNNRDGDDPDPVKDAVRTRQLILGQNLLDGTIAEMEAKRTASEADRVRAQIELQKLEREKAQMDRAPSDPDDGMKEMLFGELQKLQERVDGLQTSITQSRMNELQDRLNQLSAELAQARSADSGGLDGIMAQVKTAQELVGLVTPQVPARSDDSPALEAFRLRMEDAKDQRHQEAQLRREELSARLAQDRDLREREIMMQQQHYERTDRFMADTGPRLLALGQTLLEKLRGGGAPAPGVAPAVSPATLDEVKLAPGVMVATCDQCGHPIYYRNDYPGIFCPSCSAEYRFTAAAPDEEPADSEAP